MRIRTVIVNTTFISLLFFISTHALGFGIDLKAGVNAAYMYGENIPPMPDSSSLRFYPAVGAGFGVNIVPFFTVQSELLLSQKGYKYSDDFNEKLTYLELALPLLKLKYPGNRVSPNFYVGPSLGLLLGANYFGKSGITEYDEDVKENYKALDFAGIVGAGLEFQAGPGRLIIDLRYTLGFINVLEPAVTEFPDGSTVTRELEGKTGAVSLMVGYGINIGGK